MAFIVNPVNPKVGVILTSPVFSAMFSPLFIVYLFLILFLQIHCMDLATADDGDSKGVFRTSKMQRFDIGNQGNVWLGITLKNKLLDRIKKTNGKKFPSLPARQYACS